MGILVGGKWLQVVGVRGMIYRAIWSGFLDPFVVSGAMTCGWSAAGVCRLSDDTVSFAVEWLTNRYTAIAGSPVTHDAAGNLIVDRQGYMYLYDVERRLVKIEDLSSTMWAGTSIMTWVRKLACTWAGIPRHVPMTP